MPTKRARLFFALDEKEKKPFSTSFKTFRMRSHFEKKVFICISHTKKEKFMNETS